MIWTVRSGDERVAKVIRAVAIGTCAVRAFLKVRPDASGVAKLIGLRGLRLGLLGGWWVPIGVTLHLDHVGVVEQSIHRGACEQ